MRSKTEQELGLVGLVNQGEELGFYSVCCGKDMAGLQQETQSHPVATLHSDPCVRMDLNAGVEAERLVTGCCEVQPRCEGGLD